MQTIPLLLSSCAASAAVAFSVTTLCEPQTPPAASSAGHAVTADHQAIERLDARCEQLAAQVEQLLARPERVAAAAASVDPERIRELVQDALRAEGGKPDPSKSGPATKTANDWLAELQGAGEDIGDIWTEIEAQDRLDEVLDLYRAATEAAPFSVRAQHDLARAAHAAAMARPNHKNGRFWTESDDAYGKVLALDPQHWEARYEKAVRLTFWPEAYGRTPEAMGHFEKLIAQQDSLPVEPRQARVYYWLGNLLAQQGEPGKAARIWQRGLGRHPSNESLRERLASTGR